MSSEIEGPHAFSRTALVVSRDRGVQDELAALLFEIGWTVRALPQAEPVPGPVPHLMIADLGEDETTGLVELVKLRRHGSAPILAVADLDTRELRAASSNLGADGFLARPFDSAVLQANAELLIARTTSPSSDEGGVDLGELRVLSSARQVWAAGVELMLTAREFDLLCFLVTHPRQVFTRAQLLEHVWDSNTEWQGESTVTEYVRRLRRKLVGAPGAVPHIVTVRGIGYRLDPQ